MGWATMVRWMGCALLAMLPASGLAAASTDYAESRYAGLWLQHPVYAGPSFDAFVHASRNPLHRGAAPYEWPVNSFFFADPASGNWYIYVGDYPVGYAGRPCRCVLLRNVEGDGFHPPLMEYYPSFVHRGDVADRARILHSHGARHASEQYRRYRPTSSTEKHPRRASAWRYIGINLRLTPTTPLRRFSRLATSGGCGTLQA